MPLFILNKNAKIDAECQWRQRMNKGHGSHRVHGGQHALSHREASRRDKLWHRFENMCSPIISARSLGHWISPVQCHSARAFSVYPKRQFTLPKLGIMNYTLFLHMYI